MPNSVLTRRRSVVARIAVLALISSLMVIGVAAPASAAIDTSGSCPATIPSAGFTDIGSLDATTQQAIDCVAFYDITQGAGTATTFNPEGDVVRWQMALFLTRQAEAHGLTLPTASDQGFTDIGTLPTSTQDAINQIAELGISKGAGSATTFKPFDVVPRWQMALFLYRLGNVAGLGLDTAVDGSEFSDVTGLDDETRIAIDALADAGIAEGTGSGFAPMNDVLRRQMALFLTRVLAAAGVTPPGIGFFVITPGGDQTVDPGDSIVMTVENPIAGATHSLGLFDAADVAGDEFDTGAPGGTNAEIVSVNGVDLTPVQYTEAKPSSGVITVEIEGDADFSDVVLVVWADDGDNALDLKSDDTPAETFGASGDITLLPDQAPNGEWGSFEVIFVDTDANYMVGQNGDVYTFYWGKSGDVFHYDDDFLITQGEFEMWVSEGDWFDFYDFPYSRTAGSDFDLYEDEPNAPTGVSAVAGNFDTDAGTTASDDVKVTWNAVTGANMEEPSSADYTARLYEDDNDSDTDCEAGVLAYTEVVDGDETEAVFEDVADDTYCAVVFATSWTNDSGDYSDDDVVVVDTGETSAPEIDDLDLTTDTTTVGILGAGDVVTFGFSEAMSASLGSTAATYFRINDGDSIYQVACVDDATCVLDNGPTSTDANDRLTVTLTGAPTFISGTNNGVDLTASPTVSFVSAAWDDASGNQLSLSASADVTID